MRSIASVLLVLPVVLFAQTKPCSTLVGLTSPAAKVLHNLKRQITSAVLSPDGKRLTVGTHDGHVVTLDSQSLEIRADVTRGDKPVGLAYQGPKLFGVSGNQLFEVTEDGTKTETRHVLGGESTRIAGSESVLAITQPKGVVEIRTADGGLVNTFHYPQYALFSWLPRHRHYVSGLALSADGSRVAAAIDTSKKVQVCVWETATAKRLYCVAATNLLPAEGGHSGMDGASPRCNAVHFSGDGKTLITAWSAYHSTQGYWVEKAFAFDGLTGKPLGDFGHAHLASGAPSSGESRSLASTAPNYLAVGRAGSRGVGYTIAYRWLVHGFLPRVDIWDTANSRRVATLIGHRDPVEFVLFSPDGNDFFSLSATGEVVRWSVADLIRSDGNRLFFDDGTFLGTEWKPYTGSYDGYVVQDR